MYDPLRTASSLLVAIGLLGAFDIAYFHGYRARLVQRPESRREAWIHVVRGGLYALQFLVVPNVRCSGGWYWALCMLFIGDIAVAIADVLEEPRSRASLGGLGAGEYLMHIVLSVLVGAMLHGLVVGTWGDWAEPTRLSIEAHGPSWLGGLALLMAIGSLLVACVEAWFLLRPMSASRGAEPRVSRTKPQPLHVRVQLPAAIDRVWNVTQDHRLHPGWDYRFSRIIMEHDVGDTGCDAPCGSPDPRIRRGTSMRYECDVLGLTIRGHGRYKQHLPHKQSTFEFWSDDRRSLIRYGVGLWRYRLLPDGRTELSTSFTYEVRWGMMGRVIDRALFRPLFQRLTEASFRRLAALHFAAPRARVLGRTGGRPERFAESAP